MDRRKVCLIKKEYRQTIGSRNSAQCRFHCTTFLYCLNSLKHVLKFVYVILFCLCTFPKTESNLTIRRHTWSTEIDRPSSSHNPARTENVTAISHTYAQGTTTNRMLFARSCTLQFVPSCSLSGIAHVRTMIVSPALGSRVVCSRRQV